MSQITRYPGIAPFSRAYKDVFYGRTQDIEALYKNLNVNDLVVLHGKSGMGKSSLLNAGLIPMIEERNQFYTLFIRFGSYNPQRPESLTNIFLDKVKAVLAEKSAFLPEIEGSNIQNRPSLWQYVKRLQWEKREEEGILLILDQFEEIFTYPEAEVEAFRQEYSEVVFNRMPEGFRTNLYKQVEADPDLLDRYQNELEFLDYPPTLKLLMGIRSDRLSFMDRLSSSIPNILKNTYEVKPLRLQQAREAIVKPASHGGDGFISPIFAYNPDFLERILSYLSRDYSREIEPFLLQILCQHIEAWIISQKSNDLVVDQADIGNLDTVARSYYVGVIEGHDLQTGQKRFDAHSQILARYLIEGQLIDSIHHNRISLDKTIVEQQGFPEEMLGKLVNSRIIRQEPNTVSGLSYELSHDTLLDPVLQSAQIMGNLEGVVESFYREKVDKYEQKWLETYFLSQDGQAQSFRRAELEDHSHTDDLIEDRILRLDENERIILYPMFLTPANTIRSQRSEKVLAAERQKRRRASFLAIGAGVLAIIALASMGWAINLQRKESSLKDQAVAAQTETLKQKHEADSLRGVADNQTLLAKAQSSLAEERRIDAEAQRVLAIASAAMAREAEKEARLAEQKARSAKNEAEIQRQQALINAAQARLEKAIADSAKAVAEAQLAQIQAQNAQIDEQTRLLEVSNYLTYVEENRAQDATTALRIAEYAHEVEAIDSTYQVLLELATNPNIRFYRQSYASTTSPTASAPSKTTFSSNGQYFITTDDYETKIWEIDGRLKGSIKLGKAKINSATFSPDDQYVLVSGNNAKIGLYDLNAKLVQEYRSNEKQAMGEIYYMTFSPDGELVAGASMDGHLYIWDINGKMRHRILQDDRGLETLFTPDSKLILTRNEKPHLYDRDGKLIGKLDGHESGVIGTRISPDGQKILTYDDEGILKIWNRQAKLIAECAWHSSYFYDVHFSPNSQYIISANSDYLAIIWNLKGKVVAQMEEDGPIYNARFSPDSKTVLTSSEFGNASIWDLKGTRIHRFETSFEVWDGIFSPDGSTAIIGGRNGMIEFWDTKTGAKITTLPGHTQQIDRLHVSPDGNYLLSNASDGTAKFWTMEFGPKRQALFKISTQLLLDFKEKRQERYEVQSGKLSENQPSEGNLTNYKSYSLISPTYEIPLIMREFLNSSEAAQLSKAQKSRYNIITK
ncbi:MAG: hypothetical protein AB8H47_27935 [Bacteroidia bacterium]